MKNIKEQGIIKSLKDKLGSEVGSAGVLNKGTDAAVEYLTFMSELPESDDVVRKPNKKGFSTNLVGKTKMKLPIGKLYSMGSNVGAKSESKEATGASSGGQFSQPLFTTTKKEVEEEWSDKYKRSIDCKNPKGFSQKAHCQGRKKKKVNEEELKGGKGDKKSIEDLVKKYKKIKDAEQKIRKQLKKGTEVEKEHTKNDKMAREIAIDHIYEDPKYYDKLEKVEGKKTETKEATGASSSGQYSTPAAWAKSTSKKDWRGKSKTQIPGGKFVQVKKKCKKFPYCNQGDIKALKIFDHVDIKKVIKDVSVEYGVNEDVIKNIIVYEFEQYKLNK